MKKEERKIQKQKHDQIKALKEKAKKDPKSLTFAERNVLNIIAKKERKLKSKKAA